LSEPLHVAVDLGAGSGRVFLGGMAGDELLLQEVRRFHYPPEESGGHLRWGIGRILREIEDGLREAGERARERSRPIRSIGVDGWGVDYGLVDAEGRLVEDPVCYRDARTQGEMERVFALVPRDEIFARTGIQFLELNTLYQLTAHARAGLPRAASRLLMIPDLVHRHLCGRAVAEYTNATTTQLVSVETGRWDVELMGRLGLPAALFPEIVAAGTDLGPLRADLASEAGLAGARIVAPATHDTGSAVLGAPLEEGWAFISSGTWSLVGVERDRPLVDARAGRESFSNEGGAFGTTRFLKNVMGLWILESCRLEWEKDGRNVGHETLLRGLDASAPSPALVFADDPRLFNPPSMLAALAAQLAETGQEAPADPAAVAKLVLDSLAFRYASVLRTAEALTGRTLRGVQVVGGGSRNDYLNQVTATVTGLPLRAGPVEATATGNLVVQAVAAGRFRSLDDARRHVAARLPSRERTPRPSPQWRDAARRYEALERRFLGAP
jgi:rhamnulokinase